ncbi:MAG: hypothetical protein FJW30_21535 [Acidobacteria bacterium]|nr:hypothetical protein [Acidobacteriota bacterium]
MPEDPDLLHFNGIDASNWGYLFPSLTMSQAGQSLLLAPESEDSNADLQWQNRQNDRLYGLSEGIDPKSLGKAGWGVMFAPETPPAVREALEPLLQLRREQAGDLFKIYERENTYRNGETKNDFLSRNGAGGGGLVHPTPKNVPYYLMIVGSPEAVPYEFQYAVDVQYAVGRLHFDTPEEYAHYAATVVAAERGELGPRERTAAFFGVSNPDDTSTALSAEQLVAPLHQIVREDQPGWNVPLYAPDQCTRKQLSSLLGGADTPAFLLSATHGMGMPMSTGLHAAHNGALLCQDWPGPSEKNGHRDHYLAAEDIPDDARLGGLIAMMFACFSAGTPATDDFPWTAKRKAVPVSDRPMLSALPRRLLAHPKGGALAVIGHVDKAWDSSFRWTGDDPQLQTFRSTVKRLLEGHPVGSAMEPFNCRYAELSVDLLPIVERARSFIELSKQEIRTMTSQKDARNFLVIGDPAVRIPAPGDKPMPPREAFVVRSEPPGVAAFEVNSYTGTPDARVLRASTRVDASGKTDVLLPTTAGQLDAALWKAHLEAVEQASSHQARMANARGAAAPNRPEPTKSE